MDPLDRLRDFGPVTMLGLHGGGQIGVGSSKSEVERAATQAELRFQSLQFPFLPFGEVEFIVNEGVQALLIGVVRPTCL